MCGSISEQLNNGAVFEWLTEFQFELLRPQWPISREGWKATSPLLFPKSGLEADPQMGRGVY